MSLHRRRRPIIGYRFETDDLLDDTAPRRILTAAKADGVVVDFDFGRRFFWFDGPPGAALRAVRRAIVAVVPGARVWRPERDRAEDPGRAKG